MSKIITTDPAPLTEIDDRKLAGVTGGGDTDWVNLGGGIASGFCAFGPISRLVLQKGSEILRRIR